MAANVGKVVAIEGTWRAHVQHRGETGEKLNICGPRRSAAVEAQKDLDLMRLAAAEFSDRAQMYEAMQVEAARILDRVGVSTKSLAHTPRRTDARAPRISSSATVQVRQRVRQDPPLAR